MKKKLSAVFAVIIVMWAGFASVDIYRVYHFERPLFCLPTQRYKDGGSAHYTGLGYSFDIEGNFMPEDEFPGITKSTAYLMGLEVFTRVRD